VMRSIFVMVACDPESVQLGNGQLDGKDVPKIVHDFF
jgi:hypothetical protein